MSELNPFIIGFISQESNLSKNKLFLQLIEDMFILIKTPVSIKAASVKNDV